MREIKFRGKDDHEWFYGSLVELPLKTLIAYSYVDKNNMCWTEHKHIAPATVGQFTGLLDSDGREIYEGDVVLIHDRHGVVIYDKDGFCVDFPGVNFMMSLLRCLLRSTDCKVIGNIHDNPELLGGEGDNDTF